MDRPPPRSRRTPQSSTNLCINAWALPVPILFELFIWPEKSEICVRATSSADNAAAKMNHTSSFHVSALCLVGTVIYCEICIWKYVVCVSCGDGYISFIKKPYRKRRRIGDKRARSRVDNKGLPRQSIPKTCKYTRRLCIFSQKKQKRRKETRYSFRLNTCLSGTKPAINQPPKKMKWNTHPTFTLKVPIINLNLLMRQTQR